MTFTPQRSAVWTWAGGGVGSQMQDQGSLAPHGHFSNPNDVRFVVIPSVCPFSVCQGGSVIFFAVLAQIRTTVDISISRLFGLVLALARTARDELLTRRDCASYAVELCYLTLTHTEHQKHVSQVQ